MGLETDILKNEKDTEETLNLLVSLEDCPRKDYLRSELYEKITELIRLYAQKMRTMHRSSGFATGTDLLGKLRIKRMPLETAKSNVKVNNFLMDCEGINDFLIPAEYAYIPKQPDVIFVSPNFKGQQLISKRSENGEPKAPLTVIEQHLNFSGMLHPLTAPTNALPEDYAKKFSEIFKVLADNGVNLSPTAERTVYDLLPEYSSRSKVNFWDRSLQNAKFNQDNELKEMPDWERTNTLVIPTYEAVQTILAYDSPSETERLKARAKEQLGMPDFDACFELGCLYYSLRQLMWGFRKERKHIQNKFIQAIKSLNFRVYDEANNVVETFRKAI